MPAYLDAPAALEQLRGVGLRLGVLTQSAPEAADAVLRFAGLRDRIELVLSAPESGAFKPDPRPYRMAVERTGASPDEVGFVAAHWWDVAGAKHAGLRTGWVARRDIVLPGSVPEPDVARPRPRRGLRRAGAAPLEVRPVVPGREDPAREVDAVHRALRDPLEDRDARVGVPRLEEPGDAAPGVKSSPNIATPRKKCRKLWWLTATMRRSDASARRAAP